MYQRMLGYVGAQETTWKDYGDGAVRVSDGQITMVLNQEVVVDCDLGDLHIKFNKIQTLWQDDQEVVNIRLK